MNHFKPLFRYLRHVPLLSSLTVIGLFAASVWAQPQPAAPAEAVGITVKGEWEDGRHFEGTLIDTNLHVKLDFGHADITLNKVKSIAFRPSPEGPLVASFEMNDHTRIQGKIEDRNFTVRINGNAEEFPLRNIRALQIVKKVPLSLIAIAIGLLTLSLMEIILGVDNIIFLAILVDKLPANQQNSARRIGLTAALGTRILLLFSLSWLLGLTRPLFTLPELPFLNAPEARDVSFRDLILIIGGLFLIGNSVKELHHKIESSKHDDARPSKPARFASIIAQIAAMDLIFSLDSVITAVGMVEELWVMITAMIVAMLVMLFFAQTISIFVNRNPTIKVLALSFLILIGVLLVAESLGQHIDKGYIYFAMAFAVVIEMVNMQMRKPKPSASEPSASVADLKT